MAFSNLYVCSHLRFCWVLSSYHHNHDCFFTFKTCNCNNFSTVYFNFPELLKSHPPYAVISFSPPSSTIMIFIKLLIEWNAYTQVVYCIAYKFLLIKTSCKIHRCAMVAIASCPRRVCTEILPFKPQQDQRHMKSS